MYDLVKFKNYTLVNDCGGTRSGFYHETRLFKNSCELIKARVNYYNRTWENYQYQTCMLEAISKLIDRQFDRLKNYYKAENHIQRMTQKAQKEFAIITDNDAELKELYELRDAVRGRIW